MLIYFLRHGQTKTPGTYTGISDIDLSPEGRTAVRNLAKRVDTSTLDHCYCSPLTRCRQTAALLDIMCRTSYNDDLREINFGRWEGMSFVQIAKMDQEKLNQWVKQEDHFTFPEGDRILDFNNRVESWCNQLLSTASDSVLVVTHGGVIRHAICHLLGFAPSAGFQFDIKEAALTLLSCENGFNQLHFLNRRGS